MGGHLGSSLGPVPDTPAKLTRFPAGSGARRKQTKSLLEGDGDHSKPLPPPPGLLGGQQPGPGQPTW